MRTSTRAAVAAGLCIASARALPQDMPNMPDMPGMNAAPSSSEQPEPMASHMAMPMSDRMTGTLGPYPMTREASGTAWQPDSTPMGGLHQMAGDWMLMLHGYADVIYDDQEGPRGDTKTFAESMLMAMGRRTLGPGSLGLRGMFSLDPVTMGRSG